MDVRIRVLFMFLLIWQIITFFRNKGKNIEDAIEEIQEKIKFLPNEMRGAILGITKIVALIILGINGLLLIYSLQILHYELLSFIPIVSFIIMNCDLTIFFCGTLEEYLYRGNHKWVKPLRVGSLVAAIAWFGLMIVIS